jgi:pyrophosphate--fructose-6-phosphate 1-phosphotransferase
MGRNCGWLTAATARKYHQWVESVEWLPEFGLSKDAWDVHAIFVPEAVLDIEEEAARLIKVMDEVGCVNIFLSEGAGIADIVAEMEKAGQEVARDAFGHIRLERINPGQWFGKQFAKMLSAEKVLVQKSGYYSRSAAANAFDLALIKEMTDLAVDSAIAGKPGVIGHDEENGDVLSVIAFDRIKGGKPFDISQQWYLDLLADIGQPAPEAATQADEH